MENKRTKNLNECLKGNRIFGNNLEHGAKQQKSIGKESPKVEKRCGLLPEKEILELARGQGTAGQVELRIIRVTPRTTALTRPTKRVALLAQDLPSTEVSIKKELLTELRWWIENKHKPSPIHHAEASIFITTDAADSGWGATVNGDHLWGYWWDEQRNWHSNLKELWTVLEVLQRLNPCPVKKTLMVQSDNRTTVAYIEKQGGTKSKKLLGATEKILKFCEVKKCHLIARYIPGIYNGIADGLSRQKALPEWHLSKAILLEIFQRFGKPQIDLFASKRSAVVPLHVSEDITDTKLLPMRSVSCGTTI